MDAAALERALEEAFDHAVVYHGFTDYMRDYEVIVYMTADPRTGIAPTHHRYLFRYCVEADCRSTVEPATWRASLDDRLIRYETGADLDGYVWGGEVALPVSGGSHRHGLRPGERVDEGRRNRLSRGQPDDQCPRNHLGVLRLACQRTRTRLQPMVVVGGTLPSKDASAAQSIDDPLPAKPHSLSLSPPNKLNQSGTARVVA
jgi:hypothetical protein